jgi:ubiquinone/menaquinone biosynthesis C-methylase UbiE
MPKDLFSEQAGEYALYRPGYPAALYDYILSFVSGRDRAWDVATGNGQAALALAPHFTKVLASDISKHQLEQAQQMDNIEYVLCAAEETPFLADSFDLITIAQAYHWFNPQLFYKEASRVARPGCVVATWMYHLPLSSEPGINEAVLHFYKDTTGPYWDAERGHVDELYKNLFFPFEPLPSREFQIHKEFTREELAGYFSSWSATRHYIKANGHSPIPFIQEDLGKVWEGEAAKPFTFNVYLRIGRVTN